MRLVALVIRGGGVEVPVRLMLLVLEHVKIRWRSTGSLADSLYYLVVNLLDRKQPWIRQHVKPVVESES